MCRDMYSGKNDPRGKRCSNFREDRAEVKGYCRFCERRLAILTSSRAKSSFYLTASWKQQAHDAVVECVKIEWQKEKEVAARQKARMAEEMANAAMERATKEIAF